MYKKIRNTARFILGNICNGSGFDPDKDMVSESELHEIDKWALLKLNALIDKVKAAYDAFDFHVVVSSIHNFCITDMSNFYLDIIKDRLYCTGEKSVDRRAAQTAMYKILSALSRMIAPVLSFTAEEIWNYIPHMASDDTRSIFMNQMPEKENISADEKFNEKWDTIYKLRSDVTKALEIKRRDKFIGAPLEAKIIVHAGADYDSFSSFKDILEKVFIVSSVDVLADGTGEFGSDNFEGVSYDIERAAGEKCERCWAYSETVGKDHDHPTLCARCAAEVK